MLNDKANVLKVRSRMTKKDIEILMEAYPPYGLSPDWPLVLSVIPTESRSPQRSTVSDQNSISL